MGPPPGDVDDVVTSDAELIARARTGDTSSYAELVVRHGAAAVRLAGQIAPESDPDILVGEVFDRIRQVLQSGGGPDIAFRAYLLAAVGRLQTTGEPIPFDPVEAFGDDAVGGAFGSLPERWQLVLWHVEVEGRPAAEVAPLLAMDPDAIPGLADRAREGLGRACPDLEREPSSYLRTVIGAAVLGAAATGYLEDQQPPPVALSTRTATAPATTRSTFWAAFSGHRT